MFKILPNTKKPPKMPKTSKIRQSGKSLAKLVTLFAQNPTQHCLEVTHLQCDQMVRLLFNIWPFGNTEN